MCCKPPRDLPCSWCSLIATAFFIWWLRNRWLNVFAASMDVIIRCRSVQKSYASYTLQILDKTETFQVSIMMQSMSHQRGISTTSWITRCIPLTFSMVCGAQSTHHEKFVADPIPSPYHLLGSLHFRSCSLCWGYHGVTKLGKPGLTQRIMTCIEFIWIYHVVHPRNFPDNLQQVWGSPMSIEGINWKDRWINSCEVGLLSQWPAAIGFILNWLNAVVTS